MKKLKIILLLVFFMIANLLALCACSAGAPLEFPPFDELQSFTVQEYENGNAVSREIPLYLYQVGFGEGLMKNYKELKNEIAPALKEKYFAFRLTLADGSVRKILLFSDEGYNYLEEVGIGVWREKNSVSSYASAQNYYLKDWTYRDAFGDALESRSFSLLPEYNGAEKAIWVDLTEQEKQYGNVFGYPDRYIPDGYEAARAEDVRFIIVGEYARRDYTGYWYVPSTGQRLGNTYDETFTYTAYDLVAGEASILAEGVVSCDISQLIEEYLVERAAL